MCINRGLYPIEYVMPWITLYTEFIPPALYFVLVNIIIPVIMFIYILQSDDKCIASLNLIGFLLFMYVWMELYYMIQDALYFAKESKPLKDLIFVEIRKIKMD